ncbi:MAG: DNA polymerase Y family protein [Bryobacteraceae bacterium]|nr:DNA polymerase Y family protein [Bryobacteraceae bacterium]
MYACLHQPENHDALLELAGSFAPHVEETAPGTVVFSIDGLRRLIGAPRQIGAELARRGAERGVTANLAIAANPDCAALAAMNLPGVTVIAPGHEPSVLGKIPLERVPMPEELLEILKRWGLHTLEDVAGLPPLGLAERLGEEGLRLYQLALGRLERPLRLAPPAACYRERLELEYPASLLEPLLFYLSRLLNELCHRLESHSIGANRITTELELENKNSYTRVLELPAPQRQAAPLLKLIQLDLEAHPPPAPVTAITLAMNPTPARRLQNGLFVPQGPEPVKLQLTLTRITAMVGTGNAGSPELLNTHRPDAFRMVEPIPNAPQRRERSHSSEPALAFRFFRPALPARVRTAGRTPRHVAAAGVAGSVVEAAGPWRGSGDWWTLEAWSRDEWDVALTDGGLYRIWRRAGDEEWFVEGAYD